MHRVEGDKMAVQFKNSVSKEMFLTQINIEGKHAEYLMQLSKTSDDKLMPQKRIPIFQTFMDTICTAPVIGFQAQRKAPKDSGITKTIFPEEVQKIRDQLLFTYRVIMLLDNKDNVALQTRLDNAFRYDRDPEKRKAGEEVFWSYVRGGLEVLHEEYVQGLNNSDEDVRNMAERVKNYQIMNFNTDKTDNIYRLCSESGI